MRHKYTQVTTYSFSCGSCKNNWTTSHHSQIQKVECPSCGFNEGADRESTVEGALAVARAIS